MESRGKEGEEGGKRREEEERRAGGSRREMSPPHPPKGQILDPPLKASAHTYEWYRAGSSQS